MEIQRRDQEILAMAAKMKTLEEQHQVQRNQNQSTHVFTFEILYQLLLHINKQTSKTIDLLFSRFRIINVISLC